MVRRLSASIIHTNYKNWRRPAAPNWESRCYQDGVLADSDPQRMAHDHVLTRVPNRPGIVERFEKAVPVFDRVVENPAAAQRVEFPLVPTPQHRSGSELETLK